MPGFHSKHNSVSEASKETDQFVAKLLGKGKVEGEDFVRIDYNRVLELQKATAGKFSPRQMVEFKTPHHDFPKGTKGMIVLGHRHQRRYILPKGTVAVRIRNPNYPWTGPDYNFRYIVLFVPEKVLTPCESD